MECNDTSQKLPPLAAVLQRYQGIDPDHVHLDESTAAACLEQQPKTLESWRRNGEGPSFMKLGRRVRYRLSSILDYRDTCTFTTQRAAMTRDRKAAHR